jgi:tetratricopeptide (TPR) repeat protein
MTSKRLLPVAAVCLVLVSCKSLKTSPPVSGVAVSDELKEIYYEAENAYQAGNNNEARELFEKYIKKSPKPASALYRLACLDLRAGNKGLAFQHITQAKKADSTNYYFDLFEADLHKSVRAYSTAGNIYSKLAVRYPTHWSFFEDGAKMYKYAGENYALIGLCDQWEKAFGLREDIVVTRSEARMSLKHYDAAILDWENLIKKYPYRRQYKLNYASILNRAGLLEKSAAVYKSLVMEDPENPELLTALCQYYQEHGSKQDLWEHSKIVVKSQQMDVWKKHSCLVPFLNNLDGNKYYDSLEAPLKVLTEMHGADHRSWLFLADWYYARKQYLNAIAGFSRTLQLFSNDFQVWSKYTECLDRTANYKRMREVADSMLELFPSNPTVYYMGSTAAIGSEDWAKATTYIEEGLAYAVDEDIIVALKLNLARILNLSGKKDAALSALQELDKQYADNPNILAALAYYYSWNNVTPEEAVKYIDRAIVLMPKNGHLLYVKGFVEMKKGNYSESKTALEQAVALDANGKVYELLGDVCYKNNEALLAKENWNRAWNTGYQTPQLEQKITSGKLTN